MTKLGKFFTMLNLSIEALLEETWADAAIKFEESFKLCKQLEKAKVIEEEVVRLNLQIMNEETTKGNK